MPRDYYEVLGVDRGPDEATIKKSFRRLARELHPDVNAHDPDAEEKFKEAAAAYLNEQLVGIGLGARMLHGRLEDPSLPATERAFLTQLAPAFTELADTAEDTLYVDGAARLLGEYRFQDLTQLNQVMEMLERRVTLLSVLSEALAERDIYVRIGRENAAPALQGLSLVAANYGLPRRNLGTVSVIGPTRMDYAVAMQSVRAAAVQLSHFVEDVYGES